MKKLFCMLLLLFSVSLVVEAYAQDTKKVTLNMVNVTVGQVFKELQKVSGLNFIYDSEQLKQLKKVSVNVKDESVKSILNTIFSGTEYTYVLEGDAIAVVTRASMARKLEKQRIELSGKVIDDAGEPVMGAVVSTTNKKYYATSDLDGAFNLAVTGMESELVVSYIGYQTQKVVIDGSKSDLKIILKLNTEMLDELVVTGYQDVKKARMTGSVSKINNNDILNKGYVSMDQVLTGAISGVVAVPSGRPGEDARITIRGSNSLTGSTEPMWIVDGMPMQGESPNISGAKDIQSTIFTSGVGNITPEDIESITVLKDAAASAIYGARAANGVIVIKTKSGKVGKTIFTASANYGIRERPRNNIDMMNSQQKLDFELSTGQGYGRVGRNLEMVNRGQMSKEDFNQELARLSSINTDWFKEVYRVGQTQQYNFSMSGGSEKTQYYTSLSYMKEKGIELNNVYDKFNMNTKITHNPIKSIKITGGLSATLKNNTSSASRINPLTYALYANPYERPYKEDGSYDYDLSYDTNYSKLRPGYDWETFNVIDDLNRNTSSNRYINAEMSLKFEWEIIPGLTFTSQGLYDINSNNGRVVEGKNTYTNYRNNWYKDYTTELPLDMVNGSLNESTSYSNSYSWRNTVQYSKDIKQTHFFNVFIGQEINARKSHSSSNYSPVFDEDHRITGFPEMSGIDAGKVNFTSLGRTGKSESKLSSFFANASYSYKDRYVLSGSIRYDGSDIIGNDNQFTPLGNVAARWNIHNENFLKDVDVIDELSLRASFGYTGSIDKNAFPFVLMTLGQSIIYDGQNVPASFTYPNPNVKWQTKEDINVGFDISLFNRSIELTTNFYYNTTMNVLDLFALPLSSGRSEVKMNVADILNKGIEIDLGVTLLRKNNVQWSVKGNIGFNKSNLSRTYYKNIEDLPIVTTDNADRFLENYAVGSWFGYRFAGVDPITGNTLIYTGEGDETFDVEKMRNTTLNAKMPAPSYLGQKNPTISGGFSTTLNFYRFVFSANFDFMAGHMIKSFSTFSPLNSRNRHVNDMYSWRQPGDVSNIPYISAVSTGFSKYMYDVLLEKGDYLRCSMVSLGYNLPSRWVNKIGLSNARFTITGRDLFTISPYSGIDPTLMGNWGYPNTRKFTATLNIGF